MTDTFIFDAVRTPRGRGKADGSLNEVSPASLSVTTLTALKERNRLPEDAVDAGSLERAADRALYAAKTAGRDRIEVFSAAFTMSGPNSSVVPRYGSIESNNA